MVATSLDRSSSQTRSSIPTLLRPVSGIRNVVKPGVVVSRGRAHVSNRHLIFGSHYRMAGSRAVANEDAAHPDLFHANIRIRGWRGRWSRCDRTSVANRQKEITFQFPSSAISPIFHGNYFALVLRDRPFFGRGIPGSPAAPCFRLFGRSFGALAFHVRFGGYAF
jgi:hypothetical protein